MIRTVLYRMAAADDWAEGVLHSFSNDKAVVENMTTGDLTAVSIQPDLLKFKIVTTQWVEMQIQAQREAQSRSVMAAPPPPNFVLR